MTGRKVNTLLDDEINEGSHLITWNACNLNGMKLHPGIYFYNLSIGGDQSVTRKLIMAE